MNKKQTSTATGSQTGQDEDSPMRKVTPNTYKQSFQNQVDGVIEKSTSASSNDQKVKVFIRARPLQPHEDAQESSIMINKEDNTLIVQEGTYSINSTFDKTFGQDCSQLDVFKDFQYPISQVLDGFNFTVFAYGQTGSGKTYTMFGSDWENLINKYDQNQKKQQTFFESLETDSNYAGVIPRTIFQLFNLVSDKKKENQSLNISIYCSFLQIYNEKIYDLLQDNQKVKPLNVHESKLDGIFVEGLSEYQVQHYYDTLELMKRGEKNRAIRSTSMNTKSSRSHTIFQLIIEVIDEKSADGGTIKFNNYFIIKKNKRSRINLCDLAGSEKINKSEVMAGGHFNELRNINLSLTTLGKVIHSLSSKNKLPVPFRESKLTRILQESLIGNTITYIIANISPSIQNIDETVTTLKFAERAKHITLKIKANQINSKDDEIVKKLQKEILYLKEVLNLRRKGANVNDIHNKFIKMQAENEKLKKDHISIKEVERLIEENRKMKTEIQQLYMNQTVSKGNSPTSEDPFKNQSNSFDDIDSPLKSLPSITNSVGDVAQDSTSIMQSRNKSPSYISKTSSEKQSSKSLFFGSNAPYYIQPNTNRSGNIGNFSTFSSNSMIVSNSGNKTNPFIQASQFSSNTPIKIRIRGKTDYEMKSGYIEMNQQDIQEQDKQKKEKKRILERLDQLERIQKYNQEKLQKQIDIMDSIEQKSTNHKKYASSGSLQITRKKDNSMSMSNYQQAVMSPLLDKQKKQLKDYEFKIKELERRYFKSNQQK